MLKQVSAFPCFDKIEENPDDLVLDIGCGYAPGVHHHKSEHIGIDLNRGLCDVIGDVSHLPFRPELFDKIVASAILEHLVDPFPCLHELLRVAKKGANFDILIPVDPRSWMILLKLLIFAWPWGFFRAFKVWWRWSIRFRNAAKFKDAREHKNWIQPEHIARFLTLDKVEMLGSEHYWFSGRKGKIAGLFIDHPPKLGVERSWWIKAHKS